MNGYPSGFPEAGGVQAELCALAIDHVFQVVCVPTFEEVACAMLGSHGGWQREAATGRIRTFLVQESTPIPHQCKREKSQVIDLPDGVMVAQQTLDLFV